MGKSIIYLTLLILLTSSIFATYPNLGGEDRNFLEGSSWIDEYANLNIYSLNSPILAPLNDDLDGNGRNEIIATTGSSIHIINPNGLIYESSVIYDDYTTYNNHDKNQWVIYDYDGDGYKEIHMFLQNQTSPQIRIFEYNGTSFHTERIINFTGGGAGIYDYGDCSIACRSEQNCALFCIEDGTTPYGTIYYYGLGYNRTHQEESLIWSNNTVYDFSCGSKTSVLTPADYDNDGNIEYITSTTLVHKTGNQNYAGVLYLNQNNNLSLELEYLWTRETQWTNPYSCDVVNNDITQALVYDLNGNTGDGLETIVGYRFDEDSFVLSFLDAAHNSYFGISGYVPLDGLFNIDGDLLSNLFLVDIFSDTNEDVCFVATNLTTKNMNIFCANPQTTETWYSYALFEGTAGDNEVSYNNPLHDNQLVHTSDLFPGLVGVVEGEQVITGFGSYLLNKDDIGSYDITGTADEVLAATTDNNTLLVADFQGVGYDDFLIQTPTKLMYYDDEFQNDPPQFGGILNFDPCILTANANNKSYLYASFQALDNNTDTIEAWAELNLSDGSKQETTHFSLSSGETAVFPVEELYINATGYATLTLYLNDNVADHDNVTKTFNFLVVNNTGYSFGDGCIDSTTFAKSEEETTGLCETNAECPGSAYMCSDNLCVKKTPEDELNLILPEDSVSEGMKILIGILLIIGSIILTSKGISERGVTNAAAQLYIPLIIGFVVWLGLTIFGLLPGWLIIFAILISSALIGYRVYQTGVTN